MLDNLTIVPGTLVPIFNQASHKYDVNVTRDVALINVIAEFDPDNDIVSINDVEVENGVAMPIVVSHGTTGIAILLTMIDPDTSEPITTLYTVTVIQLKSSSREIEIMRQAWQKLDGLGYSFGLPLYMDTIPDADVERYFSGDMRDVLRELGIPSLDNVIDMSLLEMNIENRIVYHALRRFRNSSAVFFRFSTATDGKSVDKSMIPKMLAAIIAEYDQEWKAWRRTLPYSSLWTIPRTVQTSGEFPTTQ